MRLHHRADLDGRRAHGAQRCDHPFAGTPELGTRGFPSLGCGDQRPRRFFQIALRRKKALGQPLDERGRWFVGDEMARELAGQMPGSRRMAGQRHEHGASLLHATSWITRADHGLSPGLRPAACRVALSSQAWGR